MKRNFFSLLILGVVSALASTAAAKPNVLLICIDDLKPVLHCYGDATAKSPNIDALAARGVLFESAYCNQAVCSPSRNTLMTSLRPQTLGIYDLGTHFRLAAPDAVTLTQHFKENGYRAEGMGKILHVGHGNIDDAASWSVPSWKSKMPTYMLPESTSSTRPSKSGGPRGSATESAPVEDEAYGDGDTANEAVRRIQAAAQHPEQPFFIAVGFIRPHLPFVAPKKYWDMYDPATLPMPQVTEPPQGAPEYAPQFGGELRQYSDMPTVGPIDAANTRNLIHGYYAAMSYTDAQIGKVIAALNAAGLDKNTVIVLWGDHGWHLGDHSMWCKHTNYEQAAHIPLIVAAPGKAAGAKTTAMVETADIYPTLSDLAGLPARSGLDGRSFAPVLDDPTKAARDYVIHVYPRGDRLGRAIRGPRYRFVEWKVPGAEPETAEYELYDYQDDPLETKNLAAAMPDVITEMRALLASHPEAKPQIKVKASKGESKAAAKPKGKSSTKDRHAMFRSRDKDGDGRLSKEEFLLNQPDPDQAPARFPSFDANKDGFLSEEEFVKSGKVK
ncbi:MAG: sulfatase-like hydrolase/transferase [Verrucomicrobiales bacterium]|nr:sulfatase-like hydrolase/transferase [Verrucomicrobiales bacterium]